MAFDRKAAVNKIEATKRGLVRLIMRYLGEDVGRPTMYMLGQTETEVAMRRYLTSIDDYKGKKMVNEVSMWYVAALRQDGKTPGLDKAVRNQIFLDENEARSFAALKTREMRIKHSRFKAKVIIEGEQDAIDQPANTGTQS